MRDSRLWKDIYDKYAGRMLSVCMRYCRDRSTAEDMMHDGFLQAFKSLDKFTDRGDGSMRAWLSKIMVNTCLQRIRKRDVLKESEEITDINGNSSTDNSLDEKVSRIPEDVLLRFIEELPDGYRTVFNLYVFEEYSHKEIAEALGINEKSSSSQLSRAKSLLSQKISKYENYRK